MKTSLHYALLRIFLVALALNFISVANLLAQFPASGGSYTIGAGGTAYSTGSTTGNFTSFTAAVNELNNTTGTNITGSIVFNVTSGTYTEAPVISNYTNPNDYPVVFQKNGVTNPMLKTTSLGGSGGNAVFTINGGSNFTFNGIDLQDGTGSMNGGLFLISTASNGCNNNTYENGSIILESSVPATGFTFCIYSGSGSFTQGGSSSPSSAQIQNNNNYFYHNTLQNAIYGVYLFGNSTTYDQGNRVSANTISNLISRQTQSGSGVVGAMAGIEIAYQQNADIGNNIIKGLTINSGLSPASAGIAFAIGVTNNSTGAGAGSGTASIHDNTIGGVASADNIKSSSAQNSLYGIFANNGVSNIYNNVINNLSITNSVSGSVMGVTGIYNPSTSTGTHNIYGNTIYTLSSSNNTNVNGILLGTAFVGSANIYQNSISGLTTTTGNSAICLTGIEDASTSTPALVNISGNTIGNSAAPLTLSNATTSGYTIAGIYIAGSVTTLSIGNNNISYVTGTAPANGTPTIPDIVGVFVTGTITTGGVYGNSINNITGSSTAASPVVGIYCSSSSFINPGIYNNTIQTIASNNTGITLAVAGVQIGTTSSQKAYVYNNMISDVSTACTGSSGFAAGVYLPGTGQNNINNNMIYNIRANACTTTSLGGAVRGISFTTSTAAPSFRVYNNTVYLNGSATISSHVSSALYCAVMASPASSSNSGLDLRDNILVNNYSGTSAKAYAFWYGGASPYTGICAYSTSNFLYAGTNNYIFYDGTNTITTLAGYKNAMKAAGTAVSGANGGSITGNTTLNIITTSLNFFVVGQTITGSGTGVTAGTTITALGTGLGGSGSYTISPSQSNTASNITMTGTGDGDILNAQTFTKGSGSLADFNTNFPFFVSTSNLHLNTTNATDVINKGAAVNTSTPQPTPIFKVATDIDGEVRSISSATPTTIGADEPVIGPCSAPAPFSITGPTTQCGGNTAQAYGVTAAAGVTYTWSVPAGLQLVSGQYSNSVTIIFPPGLVANSSYVITVTESNGCSSGPTSANTTVTINPAVTALGAIDGLSLVCSGSSGVVYSTTDISNQSSYVWTVPSGASIIGPSSGSSITVNFTSTTTGAITVNGAATCGNGPIASLPVTVSGNTVPSITVTPSSQSTCLGGSGIALVASCPSGDCTGILYSWSPTMGLTPSVGSSVTANPSLAGTYTYTVTGTNSNNCFASATSVITINQLPVAPVASPGSLATSSQITANWNVVTGATGYFLDVATDNGFSNFVTGYNNLSVGNVLTENVTGLASGTTYFYRVRTTNGTCTSDNSNTITYSTVNGGCPFAGGTVNKTFSIICSPNGTQALSVSGSTGNNYSWQISTDNINWSDINGATTTSYTTDPAAANSNKYYRLMSKSTTCWNVTSNTAEVDISNPTITLTAGNITDNSLTLNWSPTGTGNYAISYSGTSSATQTSVTPAKTITGLTAGGTYSITVTQTGVAGCSASGTLTGVNTLCGMPTGVTLSSPANAQILVSWTGVGGANYRVYYRPLFAYGYFFTKDVSGVSSALITKQGNNNLYGNTTYEVYVSRLDCPGTGDVGQGTNPTDVTTKPVLSCSTPVIDSVRSLCPVQIEVFIHPGSSPTNTYNVYLQRLTPTILAVNSYGVSGNYFTINTPYAGDDYLIAIDSKCTGGTLSALYVWPGNVAVKPICTSPANLVLSNPTCHGFTASWNGDQCLSNPASGYNFYMRQVGTINYNSYGVATPSGGIGPNKPINWLTSGRNYQVFVRSVYSCNGFVTYGPSSLTQTIATLSSGCRDEEDVQPEESKPVVQQYSADNQEVFSLYPNPSSGQFAVDLGRMSNEEDGVRIEVINMLGQTVITHLTTISGGHMSEFINLPNGTAAGTYIVRLTAGKNVYTTKINVSK